MDEFDRHWIISHRPSNAVWKSDCSRCEHQSTSAGKNKLNSRQKWKTQNRKQRNASIKQLRRSKNINTEEHPRKRTRRKMGQLCAIGFVGSPGQPAFRYRVLTSVPVIWEWNLITGRNSPVFGARWGNRQGLVSSSDARLGISGPSANTWEHSLWAVWRTAKGLKSTKRDGAFWIPLQTS